MNRITKLRKPQIIRRKRNLLVPGNIWSKHQQRVMKEKGKKEIPQKNKKTSQIQVLKQKSHERNKHMGSHLYEILGTIVNIAKGGIQTNRPQNKEIDNDVQGFIPNR